MDNKQPIFRITIDVDTPPVVEFDEKCLEGRITIGSFSEGLSLPVECWTPNDYVEQWREGLDRFARGVHPTCLVTEMRDPNRACFINVWPIYADSQFAVIHNQILLCDEIRGRFTGKNFYEFVNPRETVSEDGTPISEWRIPIAAIDRFIDELCNLRTGPNGRS